LLVQGLPRGPARALATFEHECADPSKTLAVSGYDPLQYGEKENGPRDGDPFRSLKDVGGAN
jgi:hypothetical protein